VDDHYFAFSSFGLAWSGLAWFGLAWSGLVWSGVTWPGMVGLPVTLPSVGVHQPGVARNIRKPEKRIIEKHENSLAIVGNTLPRAATVSRRTVFKSPG
jgi:hypothetical protein